MIKSLWAVHTAQQELMLTESCIQALKCWSHLLSQLLRECAINQTSLVRIGYWQVEGLTMMSSSLSSSICVVPVPMACMTMFWISMSVWKPEEWFRSFRHSLFICMTPGGRSLRYQGCFWISWTVYLLLGLPTNTLDNKSLHSALTGMPEQGR